jgi:ADP-dependent NAD(P)H-hydrate dehydratase / NAD(P)H-hydrate epimerase
MKALTAAEMREVDRLTTERFGIPSLQLMESAGVAVARAVRRALAYAEEFPWRIAVLCGKGNNGGDAFVTSRHLRAGATRVKAYLFGKPDQLRGDAASNFHRWTESGGQTVPILDEEAWRTVWGEIADAHVIVDGVFGTGFRGAVSGAVAKAIGDVNQHSRNACAAHPALIFALDTPSGLPSDGQPADGPVLYAHKTVTFTAPKPGQLISRNADTVGALEVVSIGSPPLLIDEIGRNALRWIEPQEFASLPLVRAWDSHKGLYGHALIVAGSLGKSGAAIMASHAALCAGAGLVTVATADVVLPIVAGSHPELMSEPLAATTAGTISARSVSSKRFAQIAEGKTVLGIGPGLGQHAETQKFIRAVVRQTELPVILDADGLNAFAGRADELRKRKTKFLAITPHPGEMSRLLGVATKEIQKDRVKAAQEAAKRWNVHVVLKGSHTIVTSPAGALFVNTTGNPGLAKGGSGDVLTGVLAGLTGQFKTEDWTRVLALGVYLHGAAADWVVKDTDPSGLLATQVSTALPQARHKLLSELQWRE